MILLIDSIIIWEVEIMAKFCRSCGAALEEGAETCAACGAATTRVEVTTETKKPSEVWDKVAAIIMLIFVAVEKFLYVLADKISHLDAKKIAAGLKGMRRIILIVMAVLCLIAAILNLFGTYDVNMVASVSYDGETQSTEQSGPINELYEADEFIDLMIVNILYGVANLALIGLAVLLFLQMTKHQPTKKLYSLYVLVGLCTNVVYLILFAICGSGTQSMFGATMKYSLEVHFITWIHVILYALLFAADLALPKQTKAPVAVEAPEAPAAE